MSQNQKRDNAYYKERLEREHPAIYRDLLAGKYKSDREAFIAAGIRQPRSRLHELKNAWEKATTTEQSDFVGWLSARHGVTTTPASTPVAASARGPVAVNRRLEGWAKSRIQKIMDRRRMKNRDVMDELGFKRLNASLGRAIARGDKLQPDLIEALEKWLAANIAI
jgi:hypothetical protein